MNNKVKCKYLLFRGDVFMKECFSEIEIIGQIKA